MTRRPPAGGDDNALLASGLAAVPPLPARVTLSDTGLASPKSDGTPAEFSWTRLPDYFWLGIGWLVHPGDQLLHQFLAGSELTQPFGVMPRQLRFHEPCITAGSGS